MLIMEYCLHLKSDYIGGIYSRNEKTILANG